MLERKDIQELRAEIDGMSAADLLGWVGNRFGAEAALASSLGKEDQVLTHMIAEASLPITIFTLDTGRLFEETHQLLDQTRARYDIGIDIYMPDPADLEEVVSQRGPDFFRESVADRKHCCFLRKVRPLRRALEGKRLWITGLRRDQSDNRAEVEVLDWDEGNDLFKLNPLWDWDDARIEQFVETHAVPINPLHAKGFPSIGCAPCTRAVAPGAHPRSGRWWWESENSRECGIHIVDGRLVRGTATRP